ncbi:MAG: sigma 54-interacting transcriptional regulator [Pseudomonadota bacterium]
MDPTPEKTGSRKRPPVVDGLFQAGIPLSSILDELPAGVVVVDENHRILFLNRSFEILSGFSLARVWGLPCRFVLRTNLCNQRCPSREARHNGGPASALGDMIDMDRRRIPIRLTSTPLRDQSGRMVGFLETVEDLRGREQSPDVRRQSQGFGQILGRSRKMQEVFRVLPVIAQTDSSVLITGETGSGKDLVAEAIHESSGRNRGPFIKINCGALPETLLESELFGHQKGAFTGAVGDKPGRIRLAQNGTLFLTEIGDLPLSLQVKLLTFLDDKVVYPLGGAKGFLADVRVVAATHRHLEAMVKDGRFREDLLFRLNVVRVHLPPVRERGEDIPLLLDHFLKHFSSRFGKKIKGFSAPALQFLTAFDYPGNVRELSNIVEYAANISSGAEIELEHLPAYLTQNRFPAEPPRPVLLDSSGRPGEPAAAPGEDGVNWTSIERRLIVDALVRAKGKRTKAAEILGWGRSTLWRKMKQYGFDE